jgi:hypothetical protein
MDDRYLPNLDEGDLAMSAQNTDLAKRVAAANKISIAKAAHHMAKGAECHQAGMGILQKCHGMMTKGASKAEVAEMVKKAAGCFQQMGDHNDIAAHHITKVASSWGADWGGKDAMLPKDAGGSIAENSQTRMTEGSVPGYEADEVYAGKGVISRADAERMIADAVKAATAETALKAANEKIDLLNRLPAGPARAKAFAIGKNFAPAGGENGGEAAEKTDPMSKLMKGVEVFDMEDQDQRQRASARMIGNMIASPGTFGKSPLDPTFRGEAAQKRAPKAA